MNQSGVGVVDSSGGFTWADAIEFITDVKTANAAKGKLGYMTNAVVEGLLATLKKDAGSGLFLLENGKMAGHPLESTEQVAASTIIFGAWEQLLIGFWGGLDIFPDPYTNASKGGLVIWGYQSVDIAVRHAAAFSKCTNFATS